MFDPKARVERDHREYEERQLANYREKTIIESNKMAQAANDIQNNKEVLVLYLLLSWIDNEKPYLEKVRIPLKTMLDILGMNHGGSSYNLLKDTLKQLRARSWWVISEENGYTKESLNSYIDTVTILNKSEVEIKFSASLEDHYLRSKNKNNYARLTLEPIIAIENKWSVALYRYLTSEAFKGEVTISLEKIRASINCQKYKQYRDFKNKVLLPSMEKINTYAYIHVRMRENRIGRKVESLTFFMQEKTPAERYQAHLRAQEKINRIYQNALP